MDRGTALFWLLIALLLGGSSFFGLNAEQQRRSVQRGSTQLENGQLVSLAQVVDGDTLLVRTESNETAAVRILGIKAFKPLPLKDPTSRFGKQAIDTLQALLKDKPIRVALHSTPVDARGRTLASLYVEEQDVGMRLVREGKALVYIVYPFPAMPFYLQHQEAARADGVGLWGDVEIAQRADLLIKQWRRRAQ